MKKLLYITTVPFNFESLDGVQKKIINQLNCFSKKYKVRLLCRTDNEVLLISIPKMGKKHIDTEVSRKGILKIATKWINNNSYDLLYIRYPKSDPVLLNLLKASKNNKVKSLIEIPTYPYDKEGLETLSGRIKSVVDRTYRRQLKKFLDRIVTYSDDKNIFGVKTINTINGIVFDTIPTLSALPQDEIHLIAVSSMYRVHGYERIIQGLGEYYLNQAPNKIVILDLVGDGDYIKVYKDLVKKLDIQNYVIFHGKKFGNELVEVYKVANIGLNSLAIHRQGLLKESTLKAKEYAAYGLPIVSSSYVDAFTEEDNKKYVLRVPADDSVISIQGILDFYNNLQKNITYDMLRKNIRNAAKCVCDMEVTLYNITSYFDK